ncbi:hypothetical protein [Winogradskyella aquimaris]|uniref:Adhesin domain-containing protein n=1 Tax=Winogradskyella aquimaris TaxID=864074 RepID=A0ABU5ELD9_9FLAO|nr:hypothetical protein [Winogradskyella aquimaris]MDY2587244.1 hypothetical protein [Winogradskyella aquimaris]
MKNQFKILVLILITSAMSYSQTRRILQKHIDVDKNTSVILNFENIYVAIEESSDNQIHFEYVMEFHGYSKKEIQDKIDGIKAEVTSYDNIVTLNATSKQQVTFVTYEFKGDYGISFEDDFFSSKKDSVIRKSKDSLLAQIRKNNKTNWTRNPIEYVKGKFKKVDKDGNLSNISKENVDILRSKFLIKIPSTVKLNINARNSGIYFRNDLRNEVSITSQQGTIKAKAMTNAYNLVKIDNANFEAEAIIGGSYNLKNIKNGKIGSLKDIKINSEFSKIEIGEIQKETTITDFNSEYFFYNWSNNFERFSLYSEYSKVHFFYPTQNYSLKVVGHNTKNLFGKNKFEVNMQPTSKGEKQTMMVKEADKDKKSEGQIFFDIVHGIIVSYSHSLN